MSGNENRWADIDDAGYWHAPEAEEKPDGPAVTDDIISQEKKEEPLVKLSSGTFIEPSMGFEFNKQCKVRIKVDYLDESARNMKKVNFSLFSKYLGKTENLNVSKDGYEQDGYAEADVTLYYPSTYDEEKDRNVKYFFRATHRRGEKAVDSMELDMPQPLHFVELKKDGYDENGANKYNKEKDGDNYKEKQVVTELQKNLVTLGFLADSKDATDGYFGDTTDTAVREFQDYAIKTDRMKRSKGKIEQADKALDQSGPDGIVGKKTADEIDLWLRKDWVKPEITLRHGEYDDTGVQNGKGNKGTDDHHKGTPVVKAQENLQNVGVYKEYNVDGWFHDKMQDAVKRFQEAAEKGEFLINNVLTDIGEKLAGHRKGSYCPKTRAYLQKVVKKNGVVPAGKVIKKGAKGDIVVEINIRLSGFGGGVPSDVFDEFTEVKVKQFQKDYMKIKTPSGEVDEETASKIDEFGQKFTVDFDRLKCLCGKCGGFGKGRHKNDFFEKKDKYGNPKQHTEATHRYEYPGMHRSLLWAVRGLEFHLDKETLFSAKIDKFSSGYRCNDHILTIQRQTVNHMGKAVDIHFSTKIGQTWITSKNDKDNNDLCEEIRKICLKSSVLNAQMEWGSLNRFSLESTVDGAKTWVHADVRMFEKKYLEDKFFCKNIQEMNGELFLTLFKGKE